MPIFVDVYDGKEQIQMEETANIAFINEESSSCIGMDIEENNVLWDEDQERLNRSIIDNNYIHRPKTSNQLEFLMCPKTPEQKNKRQDDRLPFVVSSSGWKKDISRQAENKRRERKTETRKRPQ